MNTLSWKLAFRNLLRNRRRSLATGIAILAGYVGLVLLGAYLIRSQNGLRASSVYLNHKGHVAILKKDSLFLYFTKPKKYILKVEEVTSLEQILMSRANQIEFTGKYLSGTGLISNGKKSIPFLALGFEPQVYQRVLTHPEPLMWAKDWVIRKEGDKFDEFIKNPQQISITRMMADIFGLPKDLKQLPEDMKTVQIAGKNFFNDLNAVNADLGSLHTTGISLAEDTSLRVPLSLLQQLYSTDGIEYLAIFLKDVSDTASFARWLRAQVDEQKLPVEVFTFYDEHWNDHYLGKMSFLIVMFSMFLVLICGAVTLSVVNSTTMGLLERLKEIGTLRAIGFSPSHVIYLFIEEIFILTVFAISGGLVFAVVIASAVNKANINFSPPGAEGTIQFMLILDTSLCFGVACFILFLTTACSALVCYYKTKTKIIDLLLDTGA